MITGNFVSLSYIIEELNRKPLPGMEYNIEEIKEWAWQALSLIGIKTQNIEATKIITITDQKGPLPSDIQEFGNILEYTSQYPMEEIPLGESFQPYTYKLNNGFIYTDFDSGTIQLNYFIFPISEEGDVLIPDNIYYIKAVLSYVRLQLGERLFWQNKILNNQFNMLERDWHFYAPAAKNSTRSMSSDRLLNFRRKHLTMLPNFNNKVARGSYDVLVNQTTIE